MMKYIANVLQLLQNIVIVHANGVFINISLLSILQYRTIDRLFKSTNSVAAADCSTFILASGLYNKGNIIA